MDPRYAKYNIVTKDGCVATAIEAYPPYSQTEDGVTYTGTCVTILNIIMSKLGFCYSLVRSPNRLWGQRFDNGTWTGLIGQGQRGDVEIIMCPVVHSYQRFLVIDYAEGVTYTDYSIIYRRPIAQPNFFGFLLPFSVQTWLLIIASGVILTGLTLFIKKWSPVGREDSASNPEWQEKHRFGLSALWPVRGIFFQPLTKKPRGSGGRIMVSFWYVLSVILAVTYKCNLKALLIVPKVGVPFDDLKGLVSQDQMKWSFLDGSIIPLHFQPAYEADPSSLMGRGWAGKGELYKNTGLIPQFVLEKDLACIELTEKLVQVLSDDFSKSGRCRFAIASHSFISVGFSFAGKKGSKMIQWMNPIILRLRESGIMQKILFDNAANATFCNVPPGSEGGSKSRPFMVEDLSALFACLLGGWFLGSLAFVCELLNGRIGTSKQRGVERLGGLPRIVLQEV